LSRRDECAERAAAAQSRPAGHDGCRLESRGRVWPDRPGAGRRGSGVASFGSASWVWSGGQAEVAWISR
jgi:hypothetical protein